jgi:hypothetical protein
MMTRGYTVVYGKHRNFCRVYGQRVTLTKSSHFLEYIKIHQISLQQDLEKLSEQMDALDPNCKDYAYLDIEYNWVSGQLTATHHLLSVATDIMNSSSERYE